MKAVIAIFAVLFGAQCYFWDQTHDIIPDMSIVPQVPGEVTVKATSFGDEQTYFRLLALQIQDAGDTFGRFTSLKQYDYKKLYRWFMLLDTLDNTSDYVPSMATYYFGQTPNTDDVKYVVDYLVEHAKGRVETKWWWVTQAIYLSNHKLHNKQRAMAISGMITGVRGIPIWVQQMPAFIFEQAGEMDAAYAIMNSIMEHEKDIKPGEFNFMRYFVQERLQRLDEMQNEKQHQSDQPDSPDTDED